MIANLAAKGVDPTRFPDMTYPMVLAILSDGKAGKAEDAAARTRRVLQDFRSGKYV